MKVIALAVLLGIVVSMGSALSSMTAGAGEAHSLRMARALTVRVCLSIGLFGMLIAGYYLGWISPHAIR